MKWNKFCVILLFTICEVGCTIFYPSKTPKGVNIDPIFSIQLKNDFQHIERIKNLLPSEITYNKGNGGDTFLFSSPLSKDDSRIYRNIEISSYDSRAKAAIEYSNNKKILSYDSSWRLYKEAGNEENKYFSSYKALRINKNHGIPIGIITYPEILVVFQKRNLVIVIEYTSYRDDNDYIKKINEDISYVGGLFQKSIATIGAQPSAADGRR